MSAHLTAAPRLTGYALTATWPWSTSSNRSEPTRQRRNPMAVLIRTAKRFFRRDKTQCSAIEFSWLGL
jgi:hypothetical protein